MGAPVATNPSASVSFNPLQAPPQALKNIFKAWRPHSDPAGRQPLSALDPASLVKIPNNELLRVFGNFCKAFKDDTIDVLQVGNTYKFQKLPGLVLAPSLLPPIIQRELLSRLLHRDLSNSEHKTNLHLQHDILYPQQNASFFSGRPQDLRFLSRDGNSKKNLDCQKALEKKMRWMTLGGQYDWTKKVYPAEEPPKFPEDISGLVGGLFPGIEPQAAIVNLYSPGDTLSLHRDVSEEVERGLVSISLGCNAYFIVGIHDENTGEIQCDVLLLHSGDAVFMTGKSRFAWHGVPWIVADTCPDYLEDWPGNDFPLWKGWMRNKRINLNVRQMRQESASKR